MCDYSLEMFGSRPAREFERYATTRFASGSVGLAAPGDCSTAICVQYDTRLALEGLSKDLQTSLKLGPVAEAEFIRLEHGAYRDGVRFDNGQQASLQQIGVGVGVIVTRLLEKAEPATRRFALV